MTLLVFILVNAYAEFGVHPARDVVEAELEQVPGTARAGSSVRLSTPAELPELVPEIRQSTQGCRKPSRAQNNFTPSSHQCRFG